MDQPERGILLQRVRDDISMTRSAYQVLYQSAVIFAMRKQQQAEHGRAELEQTIDEEEKLRTKQKNRIIELETRIAAIKKRNAERD